MHGLKEEGNISESAAPVKSNWDHVCSFDFVDNPVPASDGFERDLSMRFTVSKKRGQFAFSVLDSLFHDSVFARVFHHCIRVSLV